MSRHSTHLSSYLKSRREKTLNTDNRATSSPSKSTVSTASASAVRHKSHGNVGTKNSNQNNGKPTSKFSKAGVDFILPPELVSKIFSFLTPSEILVCARVCKCWNDVSNEMSLWLRHYNLIPRCVRDSILPNERTSPTFKWKTEIINRTVLHRNRKVKSILKKVKPYSGLPAGIEQSLKFLSLKWQLDFRDKDGNVYSFLNDDLFYFATSTTARWCTIELPPTPKLKSLLLSARTAVFYHRDWKPHSDSATRKSLLISFELKDLKLSKQNCASEDEMITLHTVQPGVMVAVWKHSWKTGGELAWVSVCFHYHQLLEKILRGTTESVYRPPHQPTLDDIDPFYGLQRYSATVELRSQRKLFWGNHYRELYQKSFDEDGLVLESHKEQEGMFTVKTSLPWKTAIFKNILNDMAVLDVTLLDEHKAPMWCISTAVKVAKLAKNEVDYTLLDGESSLVEYQDEVGRLRIHLVWMEDDSQNLVKSLEIQLRKDVINKWFGTNY